MSTTDAAEPEVIPSADVQAARDASNRWVRINGQPVMLAEPAGDGSGPAPVITFDELVEMAFGHKVANARVTWRRYAKGDDDRNPSDYGTLKPTSAPLIRRPGLRFTVERPR